MADGISKMTRILLSTTRHMPHSRSFSMIAEQTDRMTALSAVQPLRALNGTHFKVLTSLAWKNLDPILPKVFQPTSQSPLGGKLGAFNSLTRQERGRGARNCRLADAGYFGRSHGA